jgi:D-arabinose 1-dehydrogenase-like Zn-dependent alcohol dehydrogenase
MALVAAEVYELSGPGRLELKKETLNTQDMACDEIIAKTIVTVVSPGTEVAAFSGAAPLRPMKAYPRLIGYCNVAEVTHVGSSVTSVKPGDRVSTHQSHRSAFRCKVDEINAILEGDDDPVRHASLYLWHLGYYPLLRAGIQAGHNVGVVGLGTLGLCAVSMARLAGCNVYAVSDQVGSLRTALDFGASKSYSKSEAGRNTTVFTDFTDDVGLDCVVMP